MMRRIHTRLAVSNAARRTVADHFPGDYEIVPNGVDVERFRRRSTPPPEMLGDDPLVLFVGRLDPRKGIDRLIRAMALVRRRSPARLVIVGDGPERSRLAAVAAATDVPVTIVGRVSDEALPAYYQAADVVCSPALGGESFGIVLLEAMAAARAVVATRIEGYAELVADAGCARLVEVDDVEALAHEVGVLIDSPDLRRILGAKGAAFVHRYDWSTIAGRLESIYVDLANGTSGQNEYGRPGLNASEASDRFDRPLTR
jgi:phosphatidylinositol alpha-mannosyltransferase